MIESKIEQMIEVTQVNNRDFLRYVLELKNWNEEEAIMELLDESTKELHLIEWNTKKGGNGSNNAP